MYELSANLEWLLTEAGEQTGDRVRAAARHGIPFVEIWTWGAKNLDDLDAALHETGVAPRTMCTEPMARLVDPGTHNAFLAGLRESIPVAERLGCPQQGGGSRPSRPPAPPGRTQGCTETRWRPTIRAGQWATPAR